jgi:hypothetical protein
LMNRRNSPGKPELSLVVNYRQRHLSGIGVDESQFSGTGSHPAIDTAARARVREWGGLSGREPAAAASPA